MDEKRGREWIGLTDDMPKDSFGLLPLAKEKGVVVGLEHWAQMDTYIVERMSDEHLLRAMQDVRCLSGWGIVAELCKRFHARIGDKRNNG